MIVRWIGPPYNGLNQRIWDAVARTMGVNEAGEQDQDVSDLLFHTEVLTDDWNGPSVSCHGDEDHPGVLFAEYHQTTDWTTLTPNHKD